MSTGIYLFIGGELQGIFEGKMQFREVLRDDDIERNMEELTACPGIVILADTEEVFPAYLTDADLPTGLHIAQQLRLKGIKAPILFTSYASRAELYSHKPDREILNTIGHDYIQAPVGDADDFAALLMAMKPLDDLELYDIQYSCCRKEGLVREILHKLCNVKFFIRKYSHGEEKRRALMSAIREIALVYSADDAIAASDFQLKFPVVDEGNISEAITDVTIFGERLIRENAPQSNGRNQPDGTKKGWAMLWVDDEADEHHPLINMLKARGVTVLLEQSSVRALQLLEQDWAGENRIGMVLTDYRLYESRDGLFIQQPLQGYGLLSKISASGRMIRLAALSALPASFLLKSFRHFNVRTEVFSKKDYLEDENTIRLFCEELIEMGDEHWEAILSIPDDASGWVYLEPGYRLYRNAFDYTATERKICETANSYIGHYNQYKKFPETVNFNKSNFNPDKDPQKTLEKFHPYWLGRRLAVWLSVVKQLMPAEIRTVLTGEPAGETPEERKKTENAAKNIISQVLALKLQSFPLGLTVEEKNWFHYSAGVPVYRQIEVYGNLMRKMELPFKDMVCRNAAFLNKLKNSDYSIKVEERRSKSRMEISFNRSGQPSFKSFQQVRILYQILLGSGALSDEEILHFVRNLKGLVEQEICRHKPGEISRSIRLIRDYFQREVTAYRSDVQGTLKPDEISLMEKFYKALKAGITLNTKTDMETELYTKVYMAYYFEDGDGSKMRDPAETVAFDAVLKGVSQQLKYDAVQNSLSKDITANNVRQNGEDVLNYVYQYDGADE